MVHIPALPKDEERSDGAFEPVPEGWQNVRVLKAEDTTSRDQSMTGVKLEFVIEDGPSANRHLFDRIWVTEKSLGFVRQKLDALQYIIPEGAFDLNPNDLVGRRCAVLVKHRLYDGKTQEDVSAYDRRSDSGLSPDWRSELPPEPKPIEDEVPF